jgi:glutathione S-transferase
MAPRRGNPVRQSWRTVAALSDTQPGGQLHAIDHIDIRRLNGRGPDLPRPIHPTGAQSGGARRFDIQQGIIAHVNDLSRLELQISNQPVKATAVRLGGTNTSRVQRYAEQVGQPYPAEIGVAIAERGERNAGSQSLQTRANIGEQIELVARGNENLERLIGNTRLVTTFARVLRKRSNSQVGHVVRVVRFTGRKCHPGSPHVFERETLGYARTMLAQPPHPELLGTRKHRIDVPQRIIEVEGDGADLVGKAHMSGFHLIIGNKNYSSWSLRPWILMRHLGVQFRETIVPLDTPEFKDQIGRYSPSRRVPVLEHDDLTIWDSLAICEYLAELTGRGWPAGREARARARSACAEMHSGFASLRAQWPLNTSARNRRTPMTPDLQADIERIEAIWSDCVGRADGPWLFGEYSIADAMYAPVVLRFNTYGANTPLSETARRYIATTLEDPALQEWMVAAKSETWTVPGYETGLITEK